MHSCWARPSNNAWADRKTDWFWHQDTSFYKGDDLTVWIPLTICGKVAPGVAFRITEKLSELFPTDPINKWSLAPDAVALVESSYQLYTPTFVPGDCIIFDGYAVHRTHALPGMKRERTSIDIRIAHVE